MNENNNYIINLLKDCNGNFHELKRITKDAWESNSGWTYEDFQNYFKLNNLDYNNIYIDYISIIYPYWYIDIDLGVYIELYSLKKEVFYSFDALKRINSMTNIQKELINKKEYSTFYVNVPKKFKILDFSNRYLNIEDEFIYKTFKEIYISVDFGFTNIKEEIIQYVFSKIPKNNNDTTEIIIYRGEGSESVPLELSHSWTTSYQTALFFASRYSFENCKIYSAKIKKCNIIDFIEDRNEFEVICNYNDLENVAELKAIKANNENMSCLMNLYDKEFKDYVKLIKREWFKNKGKAYDIKHTKRVLFLCLILSDDLDLNSNEKQILIQSAMLHDIGNDEEECKCGENSVNLIKKKNINPLSLNDLEFKVCLEIIKNNRLDDSFGINNLNEIFKGFNIDFDIIRLFKIFKDADTLDRVRINDLDINNLRFEESKEYVYVAAALFLLKYI